MNSKSRKSVLQNSKRVNSKLDSTKLDSSKLINSRQLGSRLYSSSLFSSKTLPRSLVCIGVASLLFVGIGGLPFMARAQTCPSALNHEVSGEGSLKSEVNRNKILDVRAKIQSKVIGQEDLVNKILIALLVDGHILIEGPTGTAKTRVVNLMAQQFHGEVKSEQMTVDTTPSVLKGEEIYDPISQSHKVNKGVLFGNFILLDELNRAQARTQNAALSAMADRKIEINGKSHPMQDVYMILATQNPESHIGTHALPEAMLDRFLFKIKVDHADYDTELSILDLALTEKASKFEESLNRTNTTQFEGPQGSKYTTEDILRAQKEVAAVILPQNVRHYLTQIITITRNPSHYDSTGQLHFITEGVSTRGTLALAQAAQATAWLAGRDEVAIEDVDANVKDVLRHRIVLDPAASIEHLTVEQVIDGILIEAKKHNRDS